MYDIGTGIWISLLLAEFLTILGAVIGYHYRDSVYAVLLGAGTGACIAILFFPTIISLAGCGCVTI